MLIRLRLLDPGYVRLMIAIRTIIASVAALLISGAICRSAELPGGMTVIATVVAVLVARSLNAATLPHRLSALLYVPAIGLLAAFVARFMLHHSWLGAAAFAAAVGGSRYLTRFGGRTRRFGRLALTPLISVLVVPVPPSAAKATGPVWGAVAGLIAVASVIAAQALLPARPAREAAAAADDFRHAAARLRSRAPGTRSHTLAARTLHRAALATEDRLDAALLPDDTSRAALDALSAAVLEAEVLVDPGAPGKPDPHHLDAALATVRQQAAAVRRLRSRERPAPDAPAPRRRTGGWRDIQPQTRLAAQVTAAMAAAFAVGHLLFPHQWMWTVITAFVVCAAARGRGDVIHRSGLRVAGAFTGAVAGTLIAHAVAGVPAVAITVIFCCLLIGVWLRDLTYAAWAFCVTCVLAVLHTLNGEHGTALLVQRPEGILVGSACGIAAACFVLPLRTDTVMRGRAAEALRALQDLLAAARESEPRSIALRRLARRFDRAARDLADAAAPARAHRSLLRRGGGQDDAAAHAADWADALAGCAPAARVLAASGTADLAAARTPLGLTAHNLGQVRRRLGRHPDTAPLRPVRGGPAHLTRLNTTLAELYERLPAPAVTPPTAPAAVAVG